MNQRDFKNLSVNIVMNLINSSLPEKRAIKREQVCVLSMNSILQNRKAQLCLTTSDDMLYETTYNGDMDEVQVKAYRKTMQVLYEAAPPAAEDVPTFEPKEEPKEQKDDDPVVDEENLIL